MSGLERFIPAWAGNTGARLTGPCRSTVHPRVGGEHPLVVARVLHQVGSSPRGRGTPRDPVRGRGVHRFIPAWAGNTRHRAPWRPSPAVHPRVGGEHSAAAVPADAKGGSSPRGRGTPIATAGLIIYMRFIPAWAGNTPSGVKAIIVIPVHPRVGGEHYSTTMLYTVDTGSSPRGRGTHGRVSGDRAGNRFIPAWAGNTVRACSEIDPKAVHPRVGGEHGIVVTIATAGLGSSPRGRGTQFEAHLYGEQQRFIPAWAGNTPVISRPRPTRSVHPRVGGEHCWLSITMWCIPGSSPRGRGTLISAMGLMASIRFIPAWAGNTLLTTV